MHELEKIKVFADGRTSPGISSGAPVLLIQDGIVQVAKLNLEDVYDLNMELERPVNKEELDELATMLITHKKAHYLKSNDCVIVSCPKQFRIE